MSFTRELSVSEPRLWRIGSREIALSGPVITGILNTTPDSFSDGGNFFPAESAFAQASRMVGEGADIIEVGGESTRPGAKVVAAQEEARRTVPVIAALRESYPWLVISIDTTKAAVAAEAVEAGADIVNDVSGLRLDSGMADVVRECGCGLVIMHSRGGVEEMASYAHATYEGDPVTTITRELALRAEAAESAGIGREQIALDPGFGFSKRTPQSMALLARLGRVVELGYPVMIGVSRKRFVTESMLAATLEGEEPPPASALPIEDRDSGTAALNVVGLMSGARLFRVHNVRSNRRALDAAWALLQAASA